MKEVNYVVKKHGEQLGIFFQGQGKVREYFSRSGEQSKFFSRFEGKLDCSPSLVLISRTLFILRLKKTINYTKTLEELD